MDEIVFLLSQSGDAAFAIDHQQVILFWNDAATELLGYEAADACGRCCWQLLAGRTLDGRICCHRRCLILEQVLSGEPIGPFDLLIRHANGGDVRVNVSTLSLVEENGLPADVLLIHLCRDRFPDPDPWRDVEKEA